MFKAPRLPHTRHPGMPQKPLARQMRRKYDLVINIWRVVAGQRYRLGLLITCLSLWLLAPAHAAPSQPIAIVGGTLIDGTGAAPLAQAVVVIQDGRLLAVGDQHTLIPPQAQRIDATGKFILPGLMDANVQLCLALLPELLARYHGRFEDMITEAAQITLRQGITTVFDYWGPRAALRQVRDDIKQGKRLGSRIYLAGNIIGQNGPLSPDLGITAAATRLSQPLMTSVNAQWEQGVGRELLSMPPTDQRQAISDYIQQGVDFIGITATGFTLREMSLLRFSPTLLRDFVALAHQADKPVQIKTTSAESLRIALEAGADMVQTCTISGEVPIPLSTLRLMRKRQVPCAPAPSTQARLDSLQPLFASLPPIVQRHKQTSDRNLRNMVAEQVPFLLSTDGRLKPEGTPRSPLNTGIDPVTRLGDGHIYWFKAMLEKGLSPMAALQAATRNVAKAHRLDADLGTLEAGKIADLLILNHNPLTDYRHYRDIYRVIKAGTVVDRAQLPRPQVLTAGLLDAVQQP